MFLIHDPAHPNLLSVDYLLPGEPAVTLIGEK
jgi:hypothetical protein